MNNILCKKENTGLLIIDIQEKLFSKIDNNEQLQEAIQKLIAVCKLFSLPIITTEHVPDKLGKTIDPIKASLEQYPYHYNYIKTTFSIYNNDVIRKGIISTEKTHWIIAGLETHICVQQSVLQMTHSGYITATCVDCTSSRVYQEHAQSISTLSKYSRTTTVESIGFELCESASDPQFRSFISLFK